MIITVDNVEIVVSQSSDKSVTLFVEMRDGQTGRVYPHDLGKNCTPNIKVMALLPFMSLAYKFTYSAIYKIDCINM